MKMRMMTAPAAVFLALGAATTVGVLRGQTPAGTSFRIERLNPALDDIVSPDAKIETHHRLQLPVQDPSEGSRRAPGPQGITRAT